METMTTRTRELTAAGVAVVLVALAAACGGSKSSAPPATSTSAVGGGTRLTGTVGPGYTISLTMGGRRVSTLKAGTYTFVVTDRASIHGFTLEQEEGGDFEQDLTSVPSTGTETVNVKLTKGEWKYYCPPHESTMNGSFTVS